MNKAPLTPKIFPSKSSSRWFLIFQFSSINLKALRHLKKLKLHVKLALYLVVLVCRFLCYVQMCWFKLQIGCYTRQQAFHVLTPMSQIFCRGSALSIPVSLCLGNLPGDACVAIRIFLGKRSHLDLRLFIISLSLVDQRKTIITAIPREKICNLFFFFFPEEKICNLFWLRH